LVVADAEKGDVVALVAVDEVVAVAAEQLVVAIASEDRVVARATVEGERDQRGEIARRADRIVAAVGVELEDLGGADVEQEGCWVDPIEAYPRAIGGYREHLGAVAAVDLGGVRVEAAFHHVAAV